MPLLLSIVLRCRLCHMECIVLVTLKNLAALGVAG